jgi:hypothetical protein
MPDGGPSWTGAVRTYAGVNRTLALVNEDLLLLGGEIVCESTALIGNPGRITRQIHELTYRTGVAPQGHSYHSYARSEEPE